MLSESQERMLIIVHKGREEEVKRIFDKWDLPWSEIGFVTDTGRMVVKHHGKVVADIPAKIIANESPVYHRDAKEPEYLKEVRAFRLDAIAESPAMPEPISDESCSPGRRLRRKTGFIANTTTWCAMARWSAPAATRRCCASRRIRCPRW